MNELYKKNKNNRGFVILFSIVISTIILLVASSMYTISKKQTILSSYARESQKAFYAANSALECALYYDNANTGSSFPITAPVDYKTEIECGGNKIFVRRLKVSATGNDKYSHSFVFRYPVVNMIGVDGYNNGCAYVLIEKLDNGLISNQGIRNMNIRISSVGFNICEENIKANNGYLDIPEYDNPMLLERRISSAYTATYHE